MKKKYKSNSKKQKINLSNWKKVEQKKDTPREYTKKDVKIFKELCDASLLGLTDEECIQWMKELNWKPPVIAGPQKITKAVATEDTDPHIVVETSWTLVDGVSNILQCNICGCHILKNRYHGVPSSCPSCGRTTRKKDPIIK